MIWQVKLSSIAIHTENCCDTHYWGKNDPHKKTLFLQHARWLWDKAWQMMLTKASWHRILVGPWKNSRRSLLKQSKRVRHTQSGGIGKTNHKWRPTTNSVPQMARPRGDLSLLAPYVNLHAFVNKLIFEMQLHESFLQHTLPFCLGRLRLCSSYHFCLSSIFRFNHCLASQLLTEDLHDIPFPSEVHAVVMFREHSSTAILYYLMW